MVKIPLNHINSLLNNEEIDKKRLEQYLQKEEMLDVLSIDTMNWSWYELFDNIQETKERKTIVDKINYFKYPNKNSDYSQFIYNFFYLLDITKEYYNNDMCTENFWSEYWPNIHKLYYDHSLINIEKTLRQTLKEYLKHMIYVQYPNNILDDKFIEQITPKFVKSLLYYTKWLTVLWEYFSKPSPSTYLHDLSSHTNTIHTYNNNDFYNVPIYNLIAGEDTYWHFMGEYVRSGFSYFDDEDFMFKEFGLNKTWDEHYDKKFEKRKSEIIMEEFQNCGNIDKILISNLRHLKTDYDQQSGFADDEGYYDIPDVRVHRSWVRKYYNMYCREKYLYNDISLLQTKKWEAIEYVLSYNSYQDEEIAFWLNTTTWIFDFLDNLLDEEQYKEIFDNNKQFDIMDDA